MGRRGCSRIVEECWLGPVKIGFGVRTEVLLSTIYDLRFMIYDYLGVYKECQHIAKTPKPR